jgi:hypothetical protein
MLTLHTAVLYLLASGALFEGAAAAATRRTRACLRGARLECAQQPCRLGPICTKRTLTSSAVCPSSFLASRSTPTLLAPILPPYDVPKITARCNGVLPSSALAIIFAPSATSALITSTCPNCAASHSCSAVVHTAGGGAREASSGRGSVLSICLLLMMLASGYASIDVDGLRDAAPSFLAAARALCSHLSPLSQRSYGSSTGCSRKLFEVPDG